MSPALSVEVQSAQLASKLKNGQDPRNRTQKQDGAWWSDSPGLNKMALSFEFLIGILLGLGNIIKRIETRYRRSYPVSSSPPRAIPQGPKFEKWGGMGSKTL